MPHPGPLMLLRQAVQQARYWRPWQQALLTLSLMTIGVALLALQGAWIGILPATAGVLLIRPTTKNLLSARATQATQPEQPTNRQPQPERRKTAI